MRRKSLAREISKVVENDNCSGCGACALISDDVEMELDDSGFMRPKILPQRVVETAESSGEKAELFRKICPGVQVSAPRSRNSHPELGPYYSVWEGYARDDAIRHAGSSAGVLSALSSWLLKTEQVEALTSARASTSRPTVSDGVRVTNPEEVINSAGSRYSPVSTADSFRPGQGEAIVAKPCEIAAVRQLEEELEHPPSIKLSFFCAGTPSQAATETLIAELGSTPSEVTQLRYRGNGWPGDFEITTRDNDRRHVPYSEAWGRVLGRQLQTRCRLCADGTGMSADIAVADYWETDERGYPKFTESVGRSAVIARSQRGHELLLAAKAADVIDLVPLGIGDLAAVQPAQLKRQRTITTRLMARRFMGRRTPRYRSITLLRLSLRHPWLSALHFGGTIVRTRRNK